VAFQDHAAQEGLVADFTYIRIASGFCYLAAIDQTCSVGRPKDWEQLRAAIAKATGSTP
jgi:hypothetical protein